MTRIKWWRPMPRQAVTRDIAIALAIKAALIVALIALFARPAFHTANDASATAAAVVGAARNGDVGP